jgi:hypothetical protein
MDLSKLISGKELFVRPDDEDLKAGELVKLLSQAGFVTVRLDGSRVATKSDLLAALASGFNFPAYFGYNWDALLDCLRSLPEFIQARGYAVLIDDSNLFLKDFPEEFENFKDIAGTAAEFLAEKHKLPLKVVML